MMYEIKALEWKETGEDIFWADTPFAKLGVGPIGINPDRFAWCWGNGGLTPCASIEDGKAKAEKYYVERLLSALTPVDQERTDAAN